MEDQKMDLKNHYGFVVLTFKNGGSLSAHYDIMSFLFDKSSLKSLFNIKDEDILEKNGIESIEVNIGHLIPTLQVVNFMDDEGVLKFEKIIIKNYNPSDSISPIRLTNLRVRGNPYLKYLYVHNVNIGCLNIDSHFYYSENFSEVLNDVHVETLRIHY